MKYDKIVLQIFKNNNINIRVYKEFLIHNNKINLNCKYSNENLNFLNENNKEIFNLKLENDINKINLKNFNFKTWFNQKHSSVYTIFNYECDDLYLQSFNESNYPIFTDKWYKAKIFFNLEDCEKAIINIFNESKIEALKIL